MMIWSQAGGVFSLTPGGYWYADTPSDHWPDDEESLKNIEKDWIGDMPVLSQTKTETGTLTKTKEEEGEQKKTTKKQNNKDNNDSNNDNDSGTTGIGKGKGLGNGIDDHIWGKEGVGDRRQEIVFIGTNMCPDKVRATLSSCLLTDDEVNQGRTFWKSYEDPFPPTPEYDDDEADGEGEDDDEGVDIVVGKKK